MGRDPSAWDEIRPGLITLGAIACWIVLWCISAFIGVNVGNELVAFCSSSVRRSSASRLRCGQ
jgi:hypothetical protein